MTATAPALAATTLRPGAAEAPTLRTARVNLMRVGYGLMVVGLAATKWPVILGDVATLPVFEGVVAALLTGMSLRALVGLRYPVRMLPLLILESAWKLIWLGAVALPNLLAGDLDPSMSSVLASVSLVVVILAVTPWDLAWRQFVRLPGDRWR